MRSTPGGTTRWMRPFPVASSLCRRPMPRPLASPCCLRPHRRRPLPYASRPPVEIATRRPPDGQRLGNEDGDSRLHPRPRSRQQRWSDMRVRRPDGSGGNGPPGAGSAGGSENLEPDPKPLPAAQPQTATMDPTAGRSQGLAGLGLLVLTAILAQLGIDFSGLVLVPAAALLFAIAAGHSIPRRHPDEDWIGRFLVLGVVVKVVRRRSSGTSRWWSATTTVATSGRTTTTASSSPQPGGGTASFPELDDWRKSNFIKVFTGWVYYFNGSNRIAGFFVFGLLAVVGSYFWYRATVDAVPGMNKRLYLGFVLFMPSIAFWPSSIGKEALMQLGIGAAALGTSYLLRQRLLLGLAIAAPGGWLLWVVRPHLLALVTVAAGCAYLAGRVRSRGTGVGSLVGRPIGMVVLAVLMAFTISQATKSLGMSDFSLSSVETELDTVSAQTDQGGSKFDNGGNSLSPLNLPEGLVTVLLRPFPFEAHNPFQLLASLESAARVRADRQAVPVGEDGAPTSTGIAVPALLHRVVAPVGSHVLVVPELRPARPPAFTGHARAVRAPRDQPGCTAPAGRAQALGARLDVTLSFA